MSSSQDFMFLGYYFNQPAEMRYHKKNRMRMCWSLTQHLKPGKAPNTQILIGSSRFLHDCD